MRVDISIINKKRLGFLVIINNLGFTKGVFTDGDLKRLMQKKDSVSNSKIKFYMTKNPFSVEESTLASTILYQMNKKKITNVCVYNKKNRYKTTGVIHIHDLLQNLR